MDAFEQLAADIFRAKGYWVLTGFKVELTREDKVNIGLPSCPRWEIDLLAYRPVSDELLVLECKSYLDSGGVHDAHFEPDARLRGRYKLFTRPELRTVIMERLHANLAGLGLCSPTTVQRLGLVYGHATAFNEERLKKRFDEASWCHFGPGWIRERLREMADAGYENSSSAIVAKLLLRNVPAARVA